MQLKGNVYYFTPYQRSQFSTEDNPKFVLELGNLDKETVTRLKDMGVNVKYEPDDASKEERGYWITSRSQFPIRTVDSNKRPIPEDTRIGNGTEVIALVEPYPIQKQYQAKANAKMGIGVRVVQIVNLVEYESEAGGLGKHIDELEVIEGGYVVPEAKPVDEDSKPPFEADDDLNDDIDFG